MICTSCPKCRRGEIRINIKGGVEDISGTGTEPAVSIDLQEIR